MFSPLTELAGNVGSVAVENWRVSVTNLTWVVEDDDLGVERSGFLWRVLLGVTADVATTDILDRDVLDVESDIVTWETGLELLVVHLDRLDFGGDGRRGKSDNHTGLDGTGLYTTDWYRSDTANLVDILEWQTEWLVGWARGRLDSVNGFEEGLALDLTGLGLLLPALEPSHVGGLLQHVVSVPSGDGYESNLLGVETDLLDKVGGFLYDFLVTSLGPLGSVHLVDGNDELTDTEGEGQQSVLAGLAVLGDTGLKLTSTGGNDEDGAISLGGTSDHVCGDTTLAVRSVANKMDFPLTLDEITVTWGINDGDKVLWSLELPESDIDCDTTLTLGLELVEYPGILEGTLSEFSSLLLELLDGTCENNGYS